MLTASKILTEASGSVSIRIPLEAHKISDSGLSIRDLIFFTKFAIGNLKSEIKIAGVAQW
jgi:hypothetical protein